MVSTTATWSFLSVNLRLDFWVYNGAESYSARGSGHYMRRAAIRLRLKDFPCVNHLKCFDISGLKTLAWVHFLAAIHGDLNVLQKQHPCPDFTWHFLKSVRGFSRKNSWSTLPYVRGVLTGTVLCRISNMTWRFDGKTTSQISSAVNLYPNQLPRRLLKPANAERTARHSCKDGLPAEIHQHATGWRKFSRECERKVVDRLENRGSNAILQKRW